MTTTMMICDQTFFSSLHAWHLEKKKDRDDHLDNNHQHKDWPPEDWGRMRALSGKAKNKLALPRTWEDQVDQDDYGNDRDRWLDRYPKHPKSILCPTNVCTKIDIWCHTVGDPAGYISSHAHHWRTHFHPPTYHARFCIEEKLTNLTKWDRWSGYSC